MTQHSKNKTPEDELQAQLSAKTTIVISSNLSEYFPQKNRYGTNNNLRSNHRKLLFIIERKAVIFPSIIPASGIWL